jgi:hypothetical protein
MDRIDLGTVAVRDRWQASLDCAPPDDQGKSVEDVGPVDVGQTLAQEGVGADEGLQLVSVEGDAVAVHDLPESGSLVIGRPQKRRP